MALAAHSNTKADTYTVVWPSPPSTPSLPPSLPPAPTMLGAMAATKYARMIPTETAVT